MSKKILEPHLWNLETIFNSQYNIPVYQRPYSWEKDQINTLLEDIFNNYKEYKMKGNKDGYYTGNIIIYDRDEKIEGHILKYDIIDGQQRIITFSLILMATYALCIKTGSDESDSTIIKIKDSLWKKINRKSEISLRSVQINSIEKECYEFICDICYKSPKKIMDYCKEYKSESLYDRRIINNFINIYKYIEDNVVNVNNEILDFADYLLFYIKIICIEANCEPKEVFSMFESINSKGKKLEVIDLVKSYIFSKIDEKSYDDYSKKWGQLTNQTNDNLYDYLYTYIRAYVTFYRQNINIDNFKNISKNELIIKYNVKNENEALKKLIDDMLDKLDYYIMLSDVEKAYNLVKSSKFRFFYKVFELNGYQHPKPLFYRTLIEYKEKKISKKSVEAIILESQLILKGINDKTLKTTLTSLDCYEEKREMSIPLISLYECTVKKGNKYVTSYDNAYELVKDFSELYSLDHLLVQTPDKDDTNFAYFKTAENTLALKDNHDFPSDLVQEGMNYDIFKKSILNKIGNLRIYYRDKNSRRRNDSIDLPEYDDFFCYKKMKKRGEDMVNIIFDICIPNKKIDIKNINIVKSDHNPKNFLTINDFIEMGELKPNDKIYITLKPNTSIATLVDGKYVIFNGEKITINDWGCKVTGWKAIRIYEYMAKVGETETFQEKRLRIDKENE